MSDGRPSGKPVADGPRLAIVVHSLSAGGAERVSVHLANSLAARGWRVSLITLESRAGDFYPVAPAVARIALAVAGESRGLAAALAGNLRRLVALRRALRAGGFDVVLGMTATIAVLTILSALGSGSRIVVSERIHPPTLRIGAAWHCLRKRVYRRADLVVVQSEQSLQWVERQAPGSRARVVPNPVVLPLPSSEPFVVPDRWVDPGRRLLLAVGRLEPQKGFDLLIDAFAVLAADHAAWTLVIVGEGAERSALEARAARLGLAGVVRMPGHAGNLADWYRRADLFVLSSRYEGFPNVLAEAMAHGCAAVSFDCPTGPRDILRDEVDGLLVESVEDPGALAGALARLMRDEASREWMGTNAREVAARYAAGRVLGLWCDALSPR